jgi:hypothetical protein
MLKHPVTICTYTATGSESSKSSLRSWDCKHGSISGLSIDGGIVAEFTAMIDSLAGEYLYRYLILIQLKSQGKP